MPLLVNKHPQTCLASPPDGCNAPTPTRTSAMIPPKLDPCPNWLDCSPKHMDIDTKKQLAYSNGCKYVSKHTHRNCDVSQHATHSLQHNNTRKHIAHMLWHDGWVPFHADWHRDDKQHKCLQSVALPRVTFKHNMCVRMVWFRKHTTSPRNHLA